MSVTTLVTMSRHYELLLGLQGCLGGVVSSLLENKKGTFNNNQINYDINEKELLEIIKGINKFEIFLLPKPFIIETDNTQVVGFIRNNTGKGIHARRLSRWQTLLSYYNFKIVHIKGSDNCLAYFLSRNIKYTE